MKIAVLIAVLIISLTLIAVFLGTFEDRTNIKPTRVACIGDSITELSNYPNNLQTMLGANYNVSNFGVSGSTVLLNSYNPYISQKAFQRAKEFLPNIVVILLGTNDARTDIYQSIDEFVADYEQLVREVQALESKPKIFLVKPPPIFDNDLNLSNANLLEGVIPRIEQVAKALGLTTIDVYTPLVNHPEYFVDGVHPNNEGASLIASEIYKAI
jgi:lysophospholipase L1-like esterase